MKSITVYNTENKPFEIVGQKLFQTFLSAERTYAGDGQSIYQQINLVQLQDKLSGARNNRYGIRLVFPGRPGVNFNIGVTKSPKGLRLDIGCQTFRGINAKTILNAASTVAAAKAARKKAKSN